MECTLEHNVKGSVNVKYYSDSRTGSNETSNASIQENLYNLIYLIIIILQECHCS